MPALEQGLVQVYTGEGKGKTTAALGLALRAAGWHLRTFIAQFMKQQPSGEQESVKLLAPYVTLERFGRAGFVRRGQPAPEDVALAHEGLERARAAITGGEYDLVILDEISAAISHGLLSEQQVLEVIELKPAHVELVLTGRDAPPGLLARADLVTRMVQEKHPYERGVAARRGIEY